MQFEIDEPMSCTIVTVNPRSEMHGEEHVPAIDVDVRMTAANDILTMFDPNLKSMLYRQADDESGQAEIEALEPVSDLPKLRSTILLPIKLTTEYIGYTFTVQRGLGGKKSNIVIPGCGLKRFRADCKEGGSVELSFRIQASMVDEATIGRLAVMIGANADILLEAPTDTQDQLAA